MESPKPRRTLLSVKQFNEQYPDFEPDIRWLIFNAKPRPAVDGQTPGNGFGPAFLRCGRRVLVDPERLFAILDQRSFEFHKPLPDTVAHRPRGRK